MPLLLSGLRLVLRKVMGQLGTAQCARTYSFQSRILPTGYKDNAIRYGTVVGVPECSVRASAFTQQCHPQCIRNLGPVEVVSVRPGLVLCTEI